MSRAEASAPLDPPSVPASPAAKFSTFSARVQAASQDAFDYAKRYGNPAGAASLHAGRGTAVLGHRQSPEAMTGALVAFATKLRAAESDRDAWKARCASATAALDDAIAASTAARADASARAAAAAAAANDAATRERTRADAAERALRDATERHAAELRAANARCQRAEATAERAKASAAAAAAAFAKSDAAALASELAAAEAEHAVRVDELNAAWEVRLNEAARRRAANGERVRSKPQRGLVDAERVGDGDEDSTASTSRGGDDSNEDGGGGGGARRYIRDETQRLRETAARLAEANADLVRRLIDDGRDEDGARRDGRRRSGRSRSRAAGTGSDRSPSRAPRRGVVVARQRRRVVARPFAREAPPATPPRPAFRPPGVAARSPGGEGEPWERTLRRDDLSLVPARPGRAERGLGPGPGPAFSSSPKVGAKHTNVGVVASRGGGGYRWVPAKRWGRRGGDGGGVRSREEARGDGRGRGGGDDDEEEGEEGGGGSRSRSSAFASASLRALKATRAATRSAPRTIAAAAATRGRPPRPPSVDGERGRGR